MAATGFPCAPTLEPHQLQRNRVGTTERRVHEAASHQKHTLKNITLDKMNRRNFEDVSSGSAIFKNHLIKNYLDQSRTINFEDVSSESAIFKDRFKIFKTLRTGARFWLRENDLERNSLVDHLHPKPALYRAYYHWLAC